MAELTEQQESPVGENKHPPRSRGGFWFGATVLLLVIGLAGAGFFLVSQLRAKQEGLNGEVKNEMSKQLGGYQSQLVAIESHIAALQADIAGKDVHFNKTVADFSHLHDEKLNSTRKEFGESILRLQRQLGKTRGDWLIADAEYLLSVANERLYLIGDVNTTRQALEAADQRLRESGDASAFKVRDQVIKDIAALSNISTVDVVGLYSAIQVLEARINNLVLLLPYAGKTPEVVKKSDNQPAENTSEGLLDSAKNKLSEIVTIKHADQSVKEILTPEQAQFIREQLRIKLEIVKLALVQQNEALYLAGLTDVKTWVEQQFSKNSDSKAFVTELNRFEAIKIRSHFPDISLSLKMLRDITKLRVETDNAMSTVETTDTSGEINNGGKAAEVEMPQATPSTEPPKDISVVPESTPVAPVENPNPAIASEPAASTEPPAQTVVPTEAPAQESQPILAMPTEPASEAAEKQTNGPAKMDTHVQPNDAADGENSNPATKFIDKIKQYLPGKH